MFTTSNFLIYGHHHFFFQIIIIYTQSLSSSHFFFPFSSLKCKEREVLAEERPLLYDLNCNSKFEKKPIHYSKERKEEGEREASVWRGFIKNGKKVLRTQRELQRKRVSVSYSVFAFFDYEIATIFFENRHNQIITLNCFTPCNLIFSSGLKCIKISSWFWREKFIWIWSFILITFWVSNEVKVFEFSS